MVGKSSKIGTFRQASPEAGALSDCATLRHLRAAYGHLIYPAQVVAGANGLGYRGQRFGASPSGKAADFDSAIRRFDPSRPSQNLFPAQPGLRLCIARGLFCLMLKIE